VGSGAGFAAGNLILIHQSREGGSGVGNWEFNKIVSVGGGTNWILAYPTVHAYNTTAQVYLMRQFSSYNGSVGISGWGGVAGGLGGFFCNGEAIITGGSLTSTGYRGGNGGNNSGAFNGQTGEGHVGAQSDAIGPNGSGGGQGRANDTNAGGGGNAATGGGAFGGTPAGNTSLTNMVFGGGGGGFSRDNQDSDGTVGGGILVVVAKRITIIGALTSGSISSFLANVGGSPSGSAGTGAGGSFLFKGQIINFGSSLVSAIAAASGGGSRPGGQGSPGRIHVDFGKSVTGNTNPAADASLDKILNDPAGGFFVNMLD